LEGGSQQVSLFDQCTLCHSGTSPRFAYKRISTADGNFKANHIKPIKPSQDMWLFDGGGIFPKRQEYFDFLKTAMETHSVFTFCVPMTAPMLTPIRRKRPVKIHSEPLQMPLWHPRVVMLQE
jgi:hypothetical protein